MPKSAESLLFTPAEAAELLKVRESWLRKKAAAGEVPRTMLGKHLRFSPANLAAIVDAFTRPAGGRRPRSAKTLHSSTGRRLVKTGPAKRPCTTT
jgi:excisionase family DNA binding protein